MPEMENKMENWLEKHKYPWPEYPWREMGNGLIEDGINSKGE
jgi:hypothetical protein